jgi:hypothetical protein
MKYSLIEETSGYQTNSDELNTDARLLVAGSKNVLIDVTKKVKSRSGYTRLGDANTALTKIRNAWVWETSTGLILPQRVYDDELEVYLGTVDGTAINAWTRVSNGWSTTEMVRRANWFSATENIDLQLMVQGDANIYMWSGAVAVVKSITGVTITKEGTTTFAQNRFLTAGDKNLICVRTGTEYVYTGGEGTTTLTGIADTTGIVAGDILVQKVITKSNLPEAGSTNHFIHNHENQICIGSEDDEEVHMAQNTDYQDFTPSSPRVAGEGATLTLTAPTRGFASLGSTLLIFSGDSTIFKIEYEQVAITTTLAETLKIKKLDTGVNQGALNQECIVPIGNAIAYLTNEVALRIIEAPEQLTGINPKTYSNPIKPDFDAEDWTGSFGIWYKNILIFSAPAGSRLYMLNFVEDADGKTFRFWNPPQVLPVGAMSIFDTGDGKELYGHSNSVPETYLLFDGASDGQYTDMDMDDKLPIEAIAIFAYNNYKQRGVLKNFDEYYIEGEITPSTTELEMGLNYDYGGVTQAIEKFIDGSDDDILLGAVGYNSLAQQSLAMNPLGGLLNPPKDTRKFRVCFEIAKEDFYEMQAQFSTNDVDKYWAIISHGANATVSKRKDYIIKK